MGKKGSQRPGVFPFHLFDSGGKLYWLSIAKAFAPLHDVSMFLMRSLKVQLYMQRRKWYQVSHRGEESSC